MFIILQVLELLKFSKILELVVTDICARLQNSTVSDFFYPMMNEIVHCVYNVELPVSKKEISSLQTSNFCPCVSLLIMKNVFYV